MALNSSSNKVIAPTDDELLQQFLYNKIHNKPLPNHITILEHDLFGTAKNPWEIWEEFGTSNSNRGKDLYFFTTLKKKSATSSRVVRTIGLGRWEGEDSGKNIFAKDKNQILGMKKRFRFEKSDTSQDGGWILHEYSLHNSLISNPLDNNYVLCRFRKNCTHLPVSKNIVAQDKPRKIVVPEPAAITIPGKRKYIIYEEPTKESNGTVVNTKSHRKEKEKYVEWTKENFVLALEAPTKSENNNVWLKENIDQNPNNQLNNGKNKIEDDGDVNTSKEEDGDAIMSWPELFSLQLREMNEGCLIEEEDVPMISNQFYMDLLSENININ